MKEKPQILAVDDEKFVLDILEDDLLEAGYQVLRADSGQKALQALGKMERCDAIVLDRMMPEMDGMAVLRELKSNPRYEDIPVILQTADGQAEHIEESLRGGAYCYLVKPYNEKMLLNAIQSAIGSRQKESLKRSMFISSLTPEIKQKQKILIVDDEVFNLDILETTLEDAGYETIRATDGKEALRILSTIEGLELIVLDRMMPGMDGISVLKTLKTHPKYNSIPVIMQTADGHHEQMMEGIRAGAYYYLIKPFNEEVLLSIVKAAIRDARKLKQMSEDVGRHKNIIGLMEEARFRFRTFDEAAKIANYVASFCPNSEKVAYGLNELMINAIEHGNLNVPYEKKYQLVAQSRWQEEVQRLVSLPENSDKFATLTFRALPEEFTILIKDQGKGFRWKEYLDFDPIRMTEPHGRGIAMSNAICFSSLEYKDEGSQAVCHIARH